MIRTVVLGAVFSFVASIVTAETLLTVTKGGVSTAHTLEQLNAMPQTEYETGNAFIDGEIRFSGPLLRDVLEASGLLGEEFVTMRAINDYEIKYPVSDAVDYDVILATRMDGKHMSVREKGPIWLMYPISEYRELEASVYKSRIIWQLVHISAE